MLGMQTHDDLVAIQEPPHQGCLALDVAPRRGLLVRPGAGFQSFQITMVPTFSFCLTSGQLLSYAATCLKAQV